MSDPFKSITTVAEAKQKYVLADRAARLMAKHCDKRIAAARKAASKEEKYLKFADEFIDYRVNEDGTIDGYDINEKNIGLGVHTCLYSRKKRFTIRKSFNLVTRKFFIDKISYVVPYSNHQ